MKKNKFEKPKMSEIVARSFTEYRAEKNEDGNMGRITGVPIVFEQKTDIGGMFEETIARGAISEDILKDVAFFYNHDLRSKPLARTRTGKLKLSVKDDGVYMDAEVNLERSDSNDLYLAIQDGDIDGMSFMFRVQEDDWTGLETDYPKRRITKIGYVPEISAVNEAAYKGTSIDARTNLLLDSDKKALDNARAAVVDTTDKNENYKLKLIMSRRNNQ